MSRYTRRQLIEILEIDEGFLRALERESIVRLDHVEPLHRSGSKAATRPSAYSERMLERARVAHSLVYELDVNLAGAAVIVRMREELGSLRCTLRELATRLERDRG